MQTISERDEHDDDVEHSHSNLQIIIPADNEKNSMISAFIEMRNEASFCDVSFLVQGSLFRAHRVVVR
jgi:hypothetical protein